ncbi:hypothetical protein C7N43_35420 [Sphingobacteriales bacterium UPWRP_1]|nr:hypothetical protein BVG80_04020 [Sphingobacteriales bacterium TSM_CSM]PSJ72211.1 hypothetical protein C7N43_35420 [Sphingobacteriales bacterium UPWRP_1]
MYNKAITDWLLQGDVAIQYLVYRNLLNESHPNLQAQIAHTGWGKQLLNCRQPNGHWGRGFYQPKWTSSHYTLLDLRNLGILPNLLAAADAVALILATEKGPDGGVNPSDSIKQSDVCLNGMFLNYAAYFGADESSLQSIIDFLVEQKLPDGGFNCRFNRPGIGARHSSLHSTLSVLEGIESYARNGYTYRLAELLQAAQTGREFILMHRFFLSDRTGQIIDKDFLHLAYPGRWHYNILRALDYFCEAEIGYDERMQPAIDVLLKKRKPNGCWNAEANYPGQQHFVMEQPGAPGRWNTLRALRVLGHFGVNVEQGSVLT